jgi:hypothetical protein
LTPLLFIGRILGGNGVKMTIKLMLFKSGEDLIADVSEMLVGDDNEKRVIGYFLSRPCLVKMRNPIQVEDDENKKTGFEVSLFPWIPLSSDEKIPVPADWLVTMVEPTAKLKEMYIQDVLDYGKENNKNYSVDEQSDTDKSD